MKKIYSLLLSLMILITIFCGCTNEKNYADLPKTSENNNILEDYTATLPDSVYKEINSKGSSFKKNTSLNIKIVIIDNLPLKTMESYSKNIFYSWNIGKNNKNNGILLLISKSAKKAIIETGKTLSLTKKNYKTEQIITKNINKYLKNNDYINGVKYGFNYTVSLIGTENNISNIQDNYFIKNVEPLASKTIIKIIILMLLPALIIVCSMIYVKIQSKYKTNIDSLRNSLPKMNKITFKNAIIQYWVTDIFLILLLLIPIIYIYFTSVKNIYFLSTSLVLILMLIIPILHLVKVILK